MLTSISMYLTMLTISMQLLPKGNHQQLDQSEHPWNHQQISNTDYCGFLFLDANALVFG